jgi:hypothetical protein
MLVLISIILTGWGVYRTYLDDKKNEIDQAILIQKRVEDSIRAQQTLSNTKLNLENAQELLKIQSRVLDRADSINERLSKDIRLSMEIDDHLKSKYSYCMITLENEFTSFVANFRRDSVFPYIIHRGKYPLFDVSVTIVDRWQRPYLFLTQTVNTHIDGGDQYLREITTYKMDIGDVSLEQKIYLPGIPVLKEQNEIILYATIKTRYNTFYQRIRWIGIRSWNPPPQNATTIIDKNGAQIYESSSKDFPKEKDGNISYRFKLPPSAP